MFTKLLRKAHKKEMQKELEREQKGIVRKNKKGSSVVETIILVVALAGLSLGAVAFITSLVNKHTGDNSETITQGNPHQDGINS